MCNKIWSVLENSRDYFYVFDVSPFCKGIDSMNQLFLLSRLNGDVIRNNSWRVDGQFWNQDKFEHAICALGNWTANFTFLMRAKAYNELETRYKPAFNITHVRSCSLSFGLCSYEGQWSQRKMERKSDKSVLQKWQDVIENRSQEWCLVNAHTYSLWLLLANNICRTVFT